MILRHYDNKDEILQVRIFVLNNGIFRIFIKDDSKRFRVNGLLIQA
jgi:hypothetical protein